RARRRASRREEPSSARRRPATPAARAHRRRRARRTRACEASPPSRNRSRARVTYNLGMAQITSAVEDYAKAIYTLEERAGSASTNDLAALLDVKPGSVSGMLRKLSSLGLVEHERYR